MTKLQDAPLRGTVPTGGYVLISEPSAPGAVTSTFAKVPASSLGGGGGGATSPSGHFYADDGAVVVHTYDRELVGDAGKNPGLRNRNATPTDKLSAFMATTSLGAWPIWGSQFAAGAVYGNLAITGYSFTADAKANAAALGYPPPATPASIGIAGFAVNNDTSSPTTTTAWAGYFHATRQPGVSYQPTFGIEVEVVNRGGAVIGTTTPYHINNGGGTYCVQLGSGGGDSAATDSGAALTFVDNPSKHELGLCFKSTSLAGTDGSIGSTGFGAAVVMARRQGLLWYAPDAQPAAFHLSSVTDHTKGNRIEHTDNVLLFEDANGAETLGINNDGSAILPRAGANLSLGNPGVASTVFVDFNTSGFPRDYDVRLQATVGASGADGQGDFNILAGRLLLNGVQITGGTGGIGEAPNDASTYGRRALGWSKVLPLSGGTLTGGLAIDGAAGTFRSLTFSTAGVNRWIVDANSTAEGGASAGSDFVIASYTDAGAALAEALKITRATSAIALAGDLTLPRLPTLPLHAATKSYVDAATPPIATTSSVGVVKPDGTTITVDGTGKITAVGGGGGGSGAVAPGTTNQFAFYSAPGTTVQGTSAITQLGAARVAVGTVTDDGSTALQVGGSAVLAGAGGTTIEYQDTSGTLNQKVAQFAHASGSMLGRFLDDNHTNATNWLSVGRSGHNPTTITLVANSSINFVTPSLLQNGSALVTGGGSGTVASSTIGQMALYSAATTVTGATMSGDATMTSAGAITVTKANGVSISTTYAPIASPALTGTPTVPTAAVDTNTTQAASTAFVIGQAGSLAPVINGTAAVGTSKRYSREDHVHPTDTSRLAVSAAASTYLPLAGGTVSGTLAIDGAAATPRPIVFSTAAVSRWIIGANSATESGGNVGSDFNILSRDDSGNTLAAPLSISRNTGVITLSTPLPLASGGVGSATAAGARTNLGLAPIAVGVDFSLGAVVANGTITVIRKAPYAFTINSMDYEVGSAGGSFTVAVQIAGTNVTGLSAVAVSSSSSSNAAATAANSVAAGQAVTIVITSTTGSPTGANLQINGTR